MFNAMSKYLVYPAYWKVRGLNVPTLRKHYEESQWLSSDELLTRQWKALSQLLHHAYQNVPFYRSRFDGVGIHPHDIKTPKDFKALPYLTKDDINSHFPDLVAQNYRIANMVKDSTGGSTGRNISFYEDKNELSHRFAATLRSDAWAGLQPGERHVQIWGSPLDFNKGAPLRRKIDSLLLRRLFVSSFALSDNDLQKTIHQIQRYAPKVLIAYPTPLHRLSRYVSDHGCGALGLTSLITSSETLYDYQRHEIEAQLQTKIYNRYGCREFGPIATECEQGNMHELNDRLFIEYIDALLDESHGGLKELVITDLHKFGMPLIRYRIGDIGTPSETVCSCGRGLPLMKHIEGRTFDLIIGSNGNFVAGTFWTLLFRSVPGIEMFQVHQTSQDLVRILLEVNDHFQPATINELQTCIREACGHDMGITIDVVPEIPVSASGKRRFVISDIAREYFSR